MRVVYSRAVRVARPIALALASIAVTLLIVEWVMQALVPGSTHHLMYVASDDPVLGVELRPDADFESQ